MHLVGVEHVLAIVEGLAFDGKMVINERGAVFGPVSTQHRDLKTDGIWYADDYKGNGLAAMLAPGKIEVRYHKGFTDDDVVRLLRALFDEPSVGSIHDWQATCQGRPLNLS
jgi:hypothetical protein